MIAIPPVPIVVMSITLPPTFSRETQPLVDGFSSICKRTVNRCLNIIVGLGSIDRHDASLAIYHNAVRSSLRSGGNGILSVRLNMHRIFSTPRIARKAGFKLAAVETDFLSDLREQRQVKAIVRGRDLEQPVCKCP